MSDCPSTMTLARYHAGQLPEPARGTTTAHLKRCPDCQAKLKALGATGPAPPDTDYFWADDAPVMSEAIELAPISGPGS
ncbi:MAG: hypothetical protein AB7I30_05355, partial [Isosphaeraceae bacterium]